MPYQPMDLGRTLAQAENIQGSRLRNLQIRDAMDPASPQNQLLQLQIEGQRIKNLSELTGGSPDPTSEMKNYRFYQGLDEAGKKHFDHMLRGQNIRKIGQVWHVVPPTGEPIPLGSLQGETDAAAAMKEAERRAILQQDLKFVPLVEEAKISAGLDAKAGLGGGTSEAELAGSTTDARGSADRRQQFINDGLAAADSIPTVRRAITLLEGGVKTGGWDNLKLWATDAFGVTGANEGELSGNLGKAVLSQLRSTFGAQFTAQEGQRLEGIEARFGQSPEVNLRLLRNAEQIVERAALRGIRAAEAAGDTNTANEIRKSLEFVFGETKKQTNMSDAEYEARKKRVLGQ